MMLGQGIEKPQTFTLEESWSAKIFMFSGNPCLLTCSGAIWARIACALLLLMVRRLFEINTGKINSYCCPSSETMCWILLFLLQTIHITLLWYVAVMKDMFWSNICGFYPCSTAIATWQCSVSMFNEYSVSHMATRSGQYKCVSSDSVGNCLPVCNFIIQRDPNAKSIMLAHCMVL